MNSGVAVREGSEVRRGSDCIQCHLQSPQTHTQGKTLALGSFRVCFSAVTFKVAGGVAVFLLHHVILFRVRSHLNALLHRI